MMNRYKLLKQGTFRYAIWDKQEGCTVQQPRNYGGTLLFSTRKEAALTVKHLNKKKGKQDQ